MEPAKLNVAVYTRPGHLVPSSSCTPGARYLTTSSVARSKDEEPVMDQAAMSKKVDPMEAAMKKSADEMAKKAMEKKKKEGGKKDAAERSSAEKAASEKAAAEKAAAKKAAAEKAAAEKAAAEKAAAEKAAAEKAAAEKAAAEKAAAEKAAAEKAAAEKAAAEKAAAEKAAAEEAAAIANMKDPIQELFLVSIRAYEQSGGLEHADSTTQAELQSELERVARQFGGTGGDMTVFPEFTFTDPTLDPINISQ